jgi:TolB-like protein/AraC-like DNA-binding protein
LYIACPKSNQDRQLTQQRYKQMAVTEKALIDKLDQFIENNLDKTEVSSDTICRELGLSRSHLYRLVKEDSQLSTSLYIRKRKLIKAKELLTVSDLKIAEVAYQIGIDSPQNFSKYFTQEFGISPTEFRKKRLGEDMALADVNADSPLVYEQNQAVSLAQTAPVKSQSYRFLWVVIALFLGSILGFYLWKYSNRKPDAGILTQQFDNSIAVLPFQNLGSTETAIFGEGMMEQIHSSLMLLENLKVISKTSCKLFKDTKKTVSQIAKELQVNYILSGSALQVGKKVEIRVELIDAKEDRAIWANIYKGDTRDIFAYANSISKEIAGKLNQKLDKAVSSKLDKIPTQSSAAYKEYLQGRQLLQARTREKLKACIKKFDNAIAFDPNFADAYSNRAVAYFILSEDNLLDISLCHKMAEKNALTAIRLDAENGLPYAVLSCIYKSQNKWTQAYTTNQIALKYSPNDAIINYWHSLILRSMGKLDEAVKYSSKAIDIDPLSPTIWGGHINNCSYARQFQLAKKAIDEGQDLFAESWLYHWGVAFYYINLYDFKAALPELEKVDKINPKIESIQSMIAYTQAQLGQRAVAEVYLKSLPIRPENFKHIAVVYAGLGDKANCLKYLEMAAVKSDSPNYLKVSPLFKFLQNEPRFKAILLKLGLSDSID